MRIRPSPALVVSILFAFAACSPSTSNDSSQSSAEARTENRASESAEIREQAVVVGRVGATPDVELVRPHPIRFLKLGGEIRLAFKLRPGEPLGVVVDSATHQLLLSVGVVGHVTSATPVQFVVRANTPGGWQMIFSQTVEAGMSWQDHLIGEESIPSGAREFEFSTDLPEGSEKLSPAFGSVIFSGSARDGEDLRPNIVLMSLDTLGADYLGSEGELDGVSPTIDAVLQRSGSFERAFSQYGSTLQSHRSLFTARYPGRDPSATLVDQLSDDGYLTLAVTENGFVSSAYGFAEGFDWYDNGPMGKKMGSAMASGTFREAADLLHRLERVAPIFMFVHTYEVHNPYTPRSAIGKQIAARLSPGDERSYNEVPRQPTDAEDRRRLWALYVGGIRDLDEEIETFFAKLSALDSAAETLVVLTSDHGEGFFNSRVGHGGIHNDVLRVPLGFHWPGKIPARQASAPVELIDVMPTILDFAGVPASAGVDGSSLHARLTSDEGTADNSDTAFSRSRKKGDAIQTQRFKLTRNGSSDSVRLYDLANDPNEVSDVSAQYPAETARLLGLMKLHTQGVDDAPLSPAGGDAIDTQTQERLRALGYID